MKRKLRMTEKEKIFREREKGGTEILISEITRFELAYRSEWDGRFKSWLELPRLSGTYKGSHTQKNNLK